MRILFYYLERSRSFRSSSRHCQVTERLSTLVPTHINVYVISSLQNVGHTVCDNIRNGNRVSEDNSWKKEKLLTVQESEIIKIIPFKKLGI